jgi:hypothetical protein
MKPIIQAQAPQENYLPFVKLVISTIFIYLVATLTQKYLRPNLLHFLKQRSLGSAPPVASTPHHKPKPKPRKNHRGGAKEHARRERDRKVAASKPNTETTGSGSMSGSSTSSVSGMRKEKKSYRAGVKYRARLKREAEAKGLDETKMTSALEPEEEEGEDGYGCDEEGGEGRSDCEGVY